MFLLSLGLSSGMLWLGVERGALTSPLIVSVSTADNSPYSSNNNQGTTSRQSTSAAAQTTPIQSGNDPAVAGTDAIELCHALAAHPMDPKKTGQGVPDEEIEPQRAIEACDAATLIQPTNAILQFQLGRAFYLAGLLDNAERTLQQAGQNGHTAADAYYAALHLENPDLDLESLHVLAEYAQLAIDGGFDPAAQILREIEQRIRSLEQALDPSLDIELFQHREIITALHDRDFAALDALTSNFYMEDYGVPMTFTEYASAFATQLNAPYPVLCPKLMNAGIGPTLQAKMEQAKINIAQRDPTTALTITGDILHDMFGGSSGDLFGGMADLSTRASQGTAQIAALKEQGTKDALILMTQYGCDSSVSQRIAKNLADYAYGNY